MDEIKPIRYTPILWGIYAGVRPFFPPSGSSKRRAHLINRVGPLFGFKPQAFPVKMSPSLDSQVLCLALHSVGLFFVAAASIPALRGIASRLVRRLKGDDGSIQGPPMGLYCDEDGEATPESLEACSGKWPSITIALLSAIGSNISVALLCVGIKSCSAPMCVATFCLQTARFLGMFEYHTQRICCTLDDSLIRSRAF